MPTETFDDISWEELLGKHGGNILEAAESFFWDTDRVHPEIPKRNLQKICEETNNKLFREALLSMLIGKDRPTD
jgi:hypothetical protein